MSLFLPSKVISFDAHAHTVTIEVVFKATSAQVETLVNDISNLADNELDEMVLCDNCSGIELPKSEMRCKDASDDLWICEDCDIENNLNQSKKIIHKSLKNIENYLILHNSHPIVKQIKTAIKNNSIEKSKRKKYSL